MLQLLWADVEALDLDDLPPLSAYRREKLNRQKLTSARRCSAGVELLLIHALRRQGLAFSLPLDIKIQPGGKPCLAGMFLQFNQSHSAHFAACALADAPLGLDIQTLSPCRVSFVRRFFAPEEQEEIYQSADKDAAFTRLWCRKESFLKATGRGLRVELSALCVARDAPEPAYAGQSYRFLEAREGDLFFCVCLPAQAAGNSRLLPEKINLCGGSDV